MARRRYISTTISVDPKVNLLAEKYSDFAALLYTWMIPHAEDDTTLTGDPDELMFTVIPALRSKTREHVIEALEAMVSEELIIWDKDNSVIYFPAQSFYKYQTYIKKEKRMSAKEQPSPKNTEKRRALPQITASPSPSPSPTPTLISTTQGIKRENCGFPASAPSEPEVPPQKDGFSFDFPEKHWELVDQIDDLPENDQLNLIVKQYNEKYPGQFKEHKTAGSVRARKEFKAALEAGVPASQIIKEVLFEVLEEGEREPPPWHITAGLVNNRGLEQTRAQVNYELARQLEREVEHTHAAQRDPPVHRRGNGTFGDSAVQAGDGP